MPRSQLLSPILTAKMCSMSATKAWATSSFLFFCLLFFASSSLLISSAFAEPVICGKNSERINYRAHLGCYSNCDNRHFDPTIECLKTIHFTEWCHCSEGYIFLSGTKGDCVRPEECPRPPRTDLFPVNPETAFDSPDRADNSAVCRKLMFSRRRRRRRRQV